MKVFSFYLLSFLLVIAIMAPSVITLLDFDNKTELVMEFNEEDNKKEEKKENKEKEFLAAFDLSTSTSALGDCPENNCAYLEKNYSFSTSIVLPPPEHLS